jgi:hypothetical protein
MGGDGLVGCCVCVGTGSERTSVSEHAKGQEGQAEDERKRRWRRLVVQVNGRRRARVKNDAEEWRLMIGR